MDSKQMRADWPTIRIVHLYPDLLNLYGDIGNIISLTQRAKRRGIAVELIQKTVGDSLRADEFDILFIGGGQDSQQSVVGQDLLRTKADALRLAAEQDRVILAICGGYQLLGKRVGLHNGAEMEGLAIVDCETRVGEGRLIGDTMVQADFLDPGASGPITSSVDKRLLIGFENHGSRTYLGSEANPLGRVIYGQGNNSEDGYEGARQRNVFCTYSHGSFLPKNPAMTDYLLTLALESRLGEPIQLPDIDLRYEAAARHALWQQLRRE